MRRRLLWATLAVVAVSVLALGLPLLVVTVRLVGDSARTELLRQVQTAAVVVEGSGVTEDRLTRLVPPGERVRVSLPDGTVLVAGPDPGSDPYEASAALPGGGTVTVSRPAGEVRARQWRAGLGVVAGMVAATLLAAFAAVLVARRLADPLRDVADRAARLGAGDYRPSPGRHGVPELDRVSDVLDRSAGRIAAAIERERALTSDVSHQLRTRLTALRMRLEEIARAPDPEVRGEATAALEQAERLSGVVDEVLAQARRARAEGATEVDVGKEVAAVVDERAPALRRLRREVLVDASGGLVARADPGRLQQAVGVLVDNALEHGAGPVRVGVRRSGTHAVVEVT
ncbi:MAG TPA: histidine kinase dimerization/phospho-acceptor domain-containing protein, partial [Mycobacteriales bacterium]|nr:histidine kinase dimerization/phospho-acceptor domain-containing protein [Mycobacteriales bacterium]